MADFFKVVGEDIIVTAPIVEVYVPYDYFTSQLYEVVGDNVRYYAVANFKVFKNEKERENRENIATYPLGIPLFVMAHPSEIDTQEVSFKKNGITRRSIVLTFYKDDKFIVNRSCIKSADNVMVLMQRLESGKLDNIPPAMVADMLDYGQQLNSVSLNLPSEMVKIFVAERYHDPNNQSRKLRFSKAKNTDDDIVSYNMREEAMQSTTYQAVTFEDINSAVITSINRKNAGIKDEPTYMEKIIRGEKIETD